MNMSVNKNSKLSSIIIIGDRVLIKLKSLSNRSKGGLLLPPGYQEKEEIQSGYVVKVGPGYPVLSGSEDESWKKSEDDVRYIPLQAKEGDLALFLQKGCYEIIYNNEKYIIVPHSSILMLERDEQLFE